MNVESFRRILSYILPVLGLVSAGAMNPLPPTSPYYGFVVPLAGVLFTFISLRVNPNGVNGPPVNPPAPPAAPPPPRGAVPVLTLIFLALAAVTFLSMGGCAQAKGALCNPGTLAIPISFDDGTVCTFTKSGPVLPGAAPDLGLTCAEPKGGAQTCNVKLPDSVCKP